MDSSLYTVDAIDGDYVRLEDPAAAGLTVPRSWLPADTTEGNILRVERSGGEACAVVTISVDSKATADSCTRVTARLDRLRHSGHEDE